MAAVKKETEEVKAEEKTETGEKMVKIKIPRVSKDQEDVFVSVNFRTWLVKRGVPVDVPECVAEVLEHREEMLEKIMEFESEKADK